MGGGDKDAPSGSKFFHFHAVFGEGPPPQKILDPPMIQVKLGAGIVIMKLIKQLIFNTNEFN